MRNVFERALLHLSCAFIALSLSACMGVENGKNQLSSKFTGIGSVSVISPTSVKVNWTPVDNYVNYKVYISTQNEPIGSSVFNSYIVNGLSASTTYMFSVSGVRADGGEDGVAKQEPITTWAHFTGPTSATAKSGNSIELAWSYPAGPTFLVIQNKDAPPTEQQLRGAATVTTQSPTGTTVSNLSSNSTYYFSVITRYPDNTTSIDHLTLGTSTLTATYTAGTLFTRPVITTPASFVGTTTFNVTNSTGTYTTKVYNGPITNGDLLATITGNGTSTATTALPVGDYDFYIRVTDTFSGGTADAHILGARSTSNVTSLIPSVSASTPTALTSLPIITTSGSNIGSYPSFQVTGSLITYRTRIYNAIDPADETTYVEVGSILGNGTVTTMSSTPFSTGEATVKAKVTSLTGEYAWIDITPSTIRIKQIENTPITPAPDINNGAGGALGYSQAVGDFNCDGYDDYAVSAPHASFILPRVSSAESPYVGQNGGVMVFYGSATGLIGLETASTAGILPSTTPANATDPLLIPAPNTGSAYGTYGQHFGHALTAGNINRDSSSGNACADLIVGAPGDNSDGWTTLTGAIYVYYGSSNGLQVTNYYTFNSLACSAGGSSCMVGKYAYTSADLPGATGMGSVFPLGHYMPIGLGYSLAIGDMNGDGYDDVATGAPDRYGTNGTAHRQGRVYVFFGTASGLSPVARSISMPATWAATAYSFIGSAIGFGYISDNKVAPYTGGTTYRKKDLIIGGIVASNGFYGAPAGAIDAAPATGSGVVVVKGSDTNTFDTVTRNASGQLAANYTFIRPKLCDEKQATDWATYTCSQNVASVDVNGDGYDDVIFGSPQMKPSATYNTWQGGFFVYYGSATGPNNIATDPVINTLPTCTAGLPCNPQAFYRTDGYSNWFFGSAINGVGDINGDTLPDLGVGAYGYNLKNGNYTYNGGAYIYYASTLGLVPGPATVIDTVNPAYTFFGQSIVGGNFRNKTFTSGLCNGKRCNDIMVGAPGRHPTVSGAQNGSARLFENDGNGFGTLVSEHNAFTPNVVSKLTNAAGDRAVIAGDINKDGYADVVAPIRIPNSRMNPGGNFTWVGSSVYPTVPTFQDSYGFIIYYGGPNGLITSPAPSLNPIGTAPKLVTNGSTNIAKYVAAAGDMNGDGYADVITGGEDGASAFLYFFYGSPTGLITSPAPAVVPASTYDPKVLSTNSRTVLTNQSGGGPVAAGDYNGDGYDDFAFMARIVIISDYFTEESQIFVIYGSANGPVSDGNLLRETDAGYATAPTYNKLTYAPTCVGGLCQPTIICGINWQPPCGTATEHAGIHSPSWGGAFRNWRRITSPGDMDRDGTDDLVAIHSHHELDGKAVGGVYIFYGSKAAGETALRASRVARLTIQQEYPGQAHAWHGYFTPNFASGTWNRITGGLAGGYDINGDGAADLLVSSPFELTGPLATSTKYVDGGAGYVFYGISGGYKSVIGSGCEGGYPCSITLGNAAGNTPDYSPLKIIDNLDTSCSSGGCNVLRFHPPASYGAYTGLKFGGGILGMGDITGDAYGDVAVTTSAATVKRLFIYSGSATGLYVTPNPSLYPTCTDGMCTPYVAPLPTSGSGWVGNASEMFYGLQGFAGAGDIDGDGKRDFFISSPFIHEKNGVGFWTGGLLIFR